MAMATKYGHAELRGSRSVIPVSHSHLLVSIDSISLEGRLFNCGYEMASKYSRRFVDIDALLSLYIM
jgi:hypothetical protein